MPSPLLIALAGAVLLIAQTWFYGSLLDKAPNRKIRGRIEDTGLITVVMTIVTTVVYFVRSVV